MKHLQLWRIWTPGWGLRDWCRYVWREGFAWQVAYMLPRKVAYLAFVRVYASSGDGPGPEYERACKAWGDRDV